MTNTFNDIIGEIQDIIGMIEDNPDEAITKLNALIK